MNSLRARDEIVPGSMVVGHLNPEGRQGRALRVIADFKLIKAVVLIGAGLGALGLLKSDWNESILRVLDHLALDHGRRLASATAERAVSLLTSASTRRLTEVAAGCFAYGGIFLVEAAGLWTRKRWAEYLTSLVTASLLPFEIDALMHRLTIDRALALLLNVAVVGYLIFHLRKQRENSNGATYTR